MSSIYQVLFSLFIKTFSLLFDYLFIKILQNFIILIFLVWSDIICLHNRTQVICTVPSEWLLHTVISFFLFFLCQFATFTDYIVYCFISAEEVFTIFLVKGGLLWYSFRWSYCSRLQWAVISFLFQVSSACLYPWFFVRDMSYLPLQISMQRFLFHCSFFVVSFLFFIVSFLAALFIHFYLHCFMHLSNLI